MISFYMQKDLATMTLRRYAPIIGMLALACADTRADILRLYTFEAAPYQVTEPGLPTGPMVRGETVNTVVCAAGQAGWNTEIRTVPQNRAIHALQGQTIDGYFAVDRSAMLDEVATRTDPIALEKWFFFSKLTPATATMGRIGVVAGSNEARWLKRQGLAVHMEVSTVGQLLAVMQRNRIDTGLADYQVLMNNLARNGAIPADPLHLRFVRYAPLYLYLNNAFAQANPDFIRNFNQSIPDCLPGTFTLAENERAILGKRAAELLRQLSGDIDLIGAIGAAPHFDSMAEILNHDSKWRALAPYRPTPLAEQILALPASDALHRWQEGQHDLVTEIMAITRDGTLAAASRLTSDYWQGDEGKFTEALKLVPGEVHLTSLRYDASSSRFLVFASQPVTDPATGLTVGVVALALDIEHALRADRGAL
ncbi:type 2 periplasmic-binding domain-containing protein [Marinobacter profundi]|nr:hypothetical protein [Marinobacter profundi]